MNAKENRVVKTIEEWDKLIKETSDLSDKIAELVRACPSDSRLKRLVQKGLVRHWRRTQRRTKEILEGPIRRGLAQGAPPSPRQKRTPRQGGRGYTRSGGEDYPRPLYWRRKGR